MASLYTEKCVYYALQCFFFMGHIWILFSFLLRLPRILHIFALPIERSACIFMKICLWAPHTNSPYLGNTFHLTWQPPIVQWLCREYEKEFIWKASKFAKKYCKVSHTDTLLHYGKPFLRRFLNQILFKHQIWPLGYFVFKKPSSISHFESKAFCFLSLSLGFCIIIAKTNNLLCVKLCNKFSTQNTNTSYLIDICFTKDCQYFLYTLDIDNVLCNTVVVIL